MEKVHVCPFCGKTTDILFSFCPFCGNRLRKEPSFEQVVSDSFSKIQNIEANKVSTRIEHLEQRIKTLEHDLDILLAGKPE